MKNDWAIGKYLVAHSDPGCISGWRGIFSTEKQAQGGKKQALKDGYKHVYVCRIVDAESKEDKGG